MEATFRGEYDASVSRHYPISLECQPSGRGCHGKMDVRTTIQHHNEGRGAAGGCKRAKTERASLMRRRLGAPSMICERYRPRDTVSRAGQRPVRARQRHGRVAQSRVAPVSGLAAPAGLAARRRSMGRLSERAERSDLPLLHRFQEQERPEGERRISGASRHLSGALAPRGISRASHWGTKFSQTEQTSRRRSFGPTVRGAVEKEERRKGGRSRRSEPERRSPSELPEVPSPDPKSRQLIRLSGTLATVTQPRKLGRHGAESAVMARHSKPNEVIYGPEHPGSRGSIVSSAPSRPEASRQRSRRAGPHPQRLILGRCQVGEDPWR